MSEVKLESEAFRDVESAATDTSEKTLIVQPYFWWTSTDYAWDVVSHPWMPPAKSEKEPDAEPSRLLLGEIRSIARTGDDAIPPVSAQGWARRVDVAVENVSLSSAWKTYHVRILPVVEQPPTADGDPVRQNEQWKNAMSQRGSRYACVTATIGNPGTGRARAGITNIAIIAHQSTNTDLSRKGDTILRKSGGEGQPETAIQRVSQASGTEPWSDRWTEAEGLWQSRVLGVVRDLLREEGPEDIQVFPTSPGRLELLNPDGNRWSDIIQFQLTPSTELLAINALPQS